jgi:hypothetical protein
VSPTSAFPIGDNSMWILTDVQIKNVSNSSIANVLSFSKKMVDDNKWAIDLYCADVSVGTIELELTFEIDI